MKEQEKLEKSDFKMISQLATFAFYYHYCWCCFCCCYCFDFLSFLIHFQLQFNLPFETCSLSGETVNSVPFKANLFKYHVFSLYTFFSSHQIFKFNSVKQEHKRSKKRFKDISTFRIFFSLSSHSILLFTVIG